MLVIGVRRHWLGLFCCLNSTGRLVDKIHLIINLTILVINLVLNNLFCDILNKHDKRREENFLAELSQLMLPHLPSKYNANKILW